MKQYRMLFVFIAVLLAVSLACIGGGTPTAAPVNTLAPTNPPPPTLAQPPTTAAQPPSNPAGNPPKPPTGATAASSGSDSSLVTFTDENKLLAFDLPGNWTYAHTKGTNLYVDTFTAPDGSAKIESLVYNDGKPFTGSDNAVFALYLLNTYYSTSGKEGEIHVSSDQIMKDGSERLQWDSTNGFSGVSFFELRGSDNKTFLMFTAWWSGGLNGASSATVQTINDAIASYRIP